MCASACQAGPSVNLSNTLLWVRHSQPSECVPPSVQDDLVCLPAKLAASLGNIGPVCLVTRVTNAITLTDPLTLRRGEFINDINLKD